MSHFEQLHAAHVQAQKQASDTKARENADTHADDTTAQTDEEDAAAADVVPGSQRRLLEAALIEADIIGTAPTALLAGPGDARKATLELQAQLDRMQWRQPEVFSRRLGELVFLANALMAGSWNQGKRFTEAEAAEVALACANLGLEHVLAETLDPGARPGERADGIEAALEDAPGIVRLFRIGWHLLQALPMRCANALLETFASDAVRHQLRPRRWLLEQVDTALHDPDLRTLVAQGEFEDAADNVVLLSLVLDPRACQCLRALLADVPRYPLQLDAGLAPATSTTRESRPLRSLRDLQRIDGLLTSLDALIRTR